MKHLCNIEQKGGKKMRFMNGKVFGNRNSCSFFLDRPSYLKALQLFLVAVLSGLIFVAAGIALAQDCPDDDGDGVCNGIDNCIAFPTVDIRDSDADGFGNPCDNCPFSSNPNQSDKDDNGLGDACDNVDHPFGPRNGISMPIRERHARCAYSLRIPEPVGDTLPPGTRNFDLAYPNI